MKKIRIAIVGCKNMGKKHIGVLREYFYNKVEIVGVLNSSIDSSKITAEELNLPYFNDISEISLDNVDGVIVSTPATSHKEIGSALLKKGIPCLMEKPMAMGVDECDELINMAKDNNTWIMVGHTENYNSAVLELKKQLNGTKVKSIEGKRVSSRQAKSAEEGGINVIAELMIHDLAIVNSLFDKDITSTKVRKNSKYKWTDQAIVDITDSNGAKANIEAIIAPIRVQRYMNIVDVNDNIYEIHFQTATLRKNGRIICQGGDTLSNELGNFVNGLKHGKEKIFVTAEEGRANVLICDNLINKCQEYDEKMQSNDLSDEQLNNLKQKVDTLKYLPRTGWVMRGVPNPQTVASHSWRMAMIILYFAKDLKLMGADISKLINMALLHDVGECVIGDIVPQDWQEGDNIITKVSKQKIEQEAIDNLSEEYSFPLLKVLFDELEAHKTIEAHIIKNIDRLELIIKAEEYRVRYPDLSRLDEFLGYNEKDVKIPFLKAIVTELKIRRVGKKYKQNKFLDYMNECAKKEEKLIDISSKETFSAKLFSNAIEVLIMQKQILQQNLDISKIMQSTLKNELLAEYDEFIKF